jgi:hypothetical protein
MGSINPRVSVRWVRVHPKLVDELSSGRILDPFLAGFIYPT